MTDSPVDPLLDNVDPADPLPAPVVAGDSYSAKSDPTPKVGPQKAVWGAVVSFVIAFAGALQVAITADVDLSQPIVWLNLFLVAVVGGGATGTTVWNTTNKVTF